MKPIEYVFLIDAFYPETLPMSRLAEYLAQLAKVFGHSEHVHFLRLDRGSAKLLTSVDAVDAPKVETRLNQVRVGDGPKEAMAGFAAIDEMLANDNAIGVLTEVEKDDVVLRFAGRNRPKRLTFPPFREQTSIDGQLVSIGGRDATAHATLRDGDIIHVGVSMSRDIAREIAQFLYGEPIRLYGSGRFERQADGVWKMNEFRVDRFEKLDDRPIVELLGAIRTLPGNRLMERDAYADITKLNEGGGESEE